MWFLRARLPEEGEHEGYSSATNARKRFQRTNVRSKGVVDPTVTSESVRGGGDAAASLLSSGLRSEPSPGCGTWGPRASYRVDR